MREHGSSAFLEKLKCVHSWRVADACMSTIGHPSLLVLRAGLARLTLLVDLARLASVAVFFLKARTACLRDLALTRIAIPARLAGFAAPVIVVASLTQTACYRECHHSIVFGITMKQRSPQLGPER